jgi:hypothetical protein
VGAASAAAAVAAAAAQHAREGGRQKATAPCERRPANRRATALGAWLRDEPRPPTCQTTGAHPPDQKRQANCQVPITAQAGPVPALAIPTTGQPTGDLAHQVVH